MKIRKKYVLTFENILQYGYWYIWRLNIDWKICSYSSDLLGKLNLNTSIPIAILIWIMIIQ